VSKERPPRKQSDKVPAHLEPLARLSVLGSATSGLLMVLAFPKFNLLPLAAVALLPLLLTTSKEPSAKRRFAGGYLAGIIFFAGTCYWIYGVQRNYGDLTVAQAAGVFALFCGALALYWGVFGWLAGYLWNLSGGPAAVPLLWVSLEYARTYFPFGGFPWLLAGYSLTNYFPLARLARWTGVYGLSYLLVALPAACIWLLLRPSARATMHLVAIVALVCGLSLTSRPQPYVGNQQAFLVQTDIPQDAAFEKWDPQSQAPLLNRLWDLTVNSVGRREPPALVIWPEVPAPFYFGHDSFSQPYAESIAQKTNSFFLMGIVAYRKDAAGSDNPLNSAVLLAPSGTLLSQYDKIHLVPFGEYVPMRQWLPFADKLTAEVGDFVPGTQRVVSKIAGGQMNGTLSVMICYEAIFPDEVRRFVSQGAEVLVNISNDGWYGSSAARDQHLLQARMRAIENNRYLLRATNTGITAAIRPDGRVEAQLPPDKPAVLRARWAFQQGETAYTRYGDWFAVAASVLTVMALGASWSGRRGRAQRSGA
jgi:apolipoprotein N-acyltransferase